MRGSTMLKSLSRKTYIRSPRSVTLQPTFMPSRSLNAAIDFFAFVMIGFCPEIASISLTATSRIFEFWIASPTDMLMTTLCEFRHHHDVAVAELLDHRLTDRTVVFLLESRAGHDLRSLYRG